MADLADDLGDELFALAGGEEEAEEGEAYVHPYVPFSSSRFVLLPRPAVSILH